VIIFTGLMIIILLLLFAGPGPTGAALEKLAREYLAADEAGRAAIRARVDSEVDPLEAGRVLDKMRTTLLAAASKEAPRLERSGTNYLYGRKRGEEKRGKYIVGGRGSKTLFLGLHGGGAGSGEAESAASAMSGGGWTWIYPEVLEKTERGWTDSGTEEFVLELVEGAKRSLKIDPDRVYITGHSMGGFGAWTIGAHHADVFAGVAAYAGAPTPIYSRDGEAEVVDIIEGVLPSYYNLPLFFYQSLDDPRVTPETNVFANRALLRLREQHPGGFEFRYEEVNGRGHAGPQDGYLPSLKWLASHTRNARPKKFLWEPVLDWKRQFYWVYWQKPAWGTLLQVEAKEGNVVDVSFLKGSADLAGFSILLGEPLVDLSKEVVVRVDGVEKFRGIVPRTLSTLLLTLPRYDEKLLFDARVDLGDR